MLKNMLMKPKQIQNSLLFQCFISECATDLTDSRQ